MALKSNADLPNHKEHVGLTWEELWSRLVNLVWTFDFEQQD